MNKYATILVLLILSIGLKVTHCASPNDNVANGEALAEEISIREDNVANGGALTEEISITEDNVANGGILTEEMSAAEENADFGSEVDSSNGEVVEGDTTLDSGEIRPVSDADATTTDTIVLDSSMVPVPEFSQLHSYTDSGLTASIHDTDPKQRVLDPDACSLLSGPIHCTPSIPDSDITKLFSDITPQVQGTASTRYFAGTESLLSGPDTTLVPDMDDTLSNFVTGHSLISDIASSMLNEDHNTFKLFKPGETSTKLEHELSTPIPDNTLTDHCNIVPKSTNEYVMSEHETSVTKSMPNDDITIKEYRRVRSQVPHGFTKTLAIEKCKAEDNPLYKKLSLMTLIAEMKTQSVDYDHTTKITPILPYDITTLPPNHGMATTGVTSPNCCKTPPETHDQITNQLGIKQMDSNNAYQLLVYQLFTYINDSRNLHVGHRYRKLASVDVWMEITHQWLCGCLLFLIYAIIPLIAVTKNFGKDRQSNGK